MPATGASDSQQRPSEETSYEATVEKMVVDFGQKLQQSLEAIKRDLKKKIADEKMAAVKKDLGLTGKPPDKSGAGATWLDDLPPGVQQQIKTMTQEQPEVAHPQSTGDAA